MTLPYIYWPTGFTLQHQITLVVYLILVAFLVFLVRRKKRELDAGRPKYESPEYMRELFGTLLDDKSKLEISLVRYHKGSWKDITGKIIEIKRKQLILQTNLTTDSSPEQGFIAFKESDLESHIMARFSMNNDVFSLFFFETSIVGHKIHNGIIDLTIAFPRSIGETQRRGFVRHFLKEGDVQRLAIWNAGAKSDLPPTVPEMGNPVYIAAQNSALDFKVINISARGIQIEFTKEADEERKINLLKSGFCVILISLKQQFVDNSLNLWLHLEPRFNGAFEGRPRVGCEVLAYSEHPPKGQPFDWVILEDDEEVPDLLAWVATEMSSAGKSKSS